MKISGIRPCVKSARCKRNLITNVRAKMADNSRTRWFLMHEYYSTNAYNEPIYIVQFLVFASLRIFLNLIFALSSVQSWISFTISHSYFNIKYSSIILQTSLYKNVISPHIKQMSKYTVVVSEIKANNKSFRSRLIFTNCGC